MDRLINGFNQNRLY